MTTAASASPVSFLANVKRLPHNGMPVVIEADDAQRERLAADHGLLSVELLARRAAGRAVEAQRRQGLGRGRCRRHPAMRGDAGADRRQGSRNRYRASIFREDSKLGRYGFHAAGEVHLDADGPDSPETFSGETIDVGALAEEFFGLAIDPYPRKEGVSLDAVVAPEDSGEIHGPLHELLSSLKQKS